MMNRRLPSLVLLAAGQVLLSGCDLPETPDALGHAPVPGHSTRAAEVYCGGGDLELAPPAADVDGLHAVPIDIQRVDARVVLDATARAADAEVSMRFRMGAVGGYPIFDLRQRIAQATINGAEVSPAKMAHHDFGGGEDAELRVLEVELPACSENTLSLRYALEQPSAPESQPIEWDPSSTRVFWNFRLWDLLPGRFLESWFPANLSYDRFAFTLDLQLRRSDLGHTLVTNGAAQELSRGHWRVDYPPAYTALSPMLALVPDDRVEAYSTALHRANGSPIPLDLFREHGVDADLSAVADDIEGYVEEFTRSTDEYPYDSLTVYLWNDLRHSEEYDGSTTSNLGSLEHEIFHTWYGRGIKPASQNDGWIDEAWDTYNTSASAFAVAPLDPRAPPVTLSSSNPWVRITPLDSYTSGAELFAGLAASMGLQPLRDAMQEFYQEHTHELVTTEQLERHLFCTSMSADVTFAFHRFVYGRTGAAPAPDPRVCP
jgi:hypothetical protein